MNNIVCIIMATLCLSAADNDKLNTLVEENMQDCIECIERHEELNSLLGHGFNVKKLLSGKMSSQAIAKLDAGIQNSYKEYRTLKRYKNFAQNIKNDEEFYLLQKDLLAYLLKKR